MSDISEKGSDFFRDLGNAARKNPLSAALIGMGVFWLFTGSRPVERAADFVRRTGFDRIPDAAGNAFEAARSTFRSGAGSIGEHVTSAKDALRDDGADALDSATRFGRDYSDAASDYARAIPGAGAEMFKAKAAEFAAEQTARATTLAEGVMGAVTEEARKQGLTIEGAKSAVGDFSTKVGRIVDAAGKGISDE